MQRKCRAGPSGPAMLDGGLASIPVFEPQAPSVQAHCMHSSGTPAKAGHWLQAACRQTAWRVCLVGCQPAGGPRRSQPAPPAACQARRAAGAQMPAPAWGLRRPCSRRHSWRPVCASPASWLAVMCFQVQDVAHSCARGAICAFLSLFPACSTVMMAFTAPCLLRSEVQASESASQSLELA